MLCLLNSVAIVIGRIKLIHQIIYDVCCDTFQDSTNGLRLSIKHDSRKISSKTGTIKVVAWHGSFFHSTTKVQLCLREPLRITSKIRSERISFLKIYTIDNLYYEIPLYTVWNSGTEGEQFFCAIVYVIRKGNRLGKLLRCNKERRS